ncbi:MAG TPA: hypothetical protein VME46_10480 [Acidimicrobiales bacterium]|nr:hypothetical protein [Acidimicrobiales bacterium]
MHPVHALEQLRYVARRWGPSEEFPAPEVAAVLAELAEESPATLLHACRRLIEYFPAAGPVWWLSARALSAPDPVPAIWAAAQELERDPTSRHLADALPTLAEARLAWPAPTLVPVVRRRRAAKGTKPASRILVVPAMAAGPTGVVVPDHVAGALGVTRDGAAGEVDTGGDERPGIGLRRRSCALWAVTGVGVVLPGALWEQLVGRLGPDARATVLPALAFDYAVGPDGASPVERALNRASCPAVAELMGWRS